MNNIAVQVGNCCGDGLFNAVRQIISAIKTIDVPLYFWCCSLGHHSSFSSSSLENTISVECPIGHNILMLKC